MIDAVNVLLVDDDHDDFVITRDVLAEIGDGSRYCVWGNDARLGQVFLNLLINAAHAIPEGNVAANEIELVTRTGPAGNAVIEVRDTGSGIKPEHLRVLFEPFFTTKPIGVGTGLGLSICHRLVHELGGSITVGSAVGRGTTFFVSLPPAPSTAVATAPRSQTVTCAKRRGRILIVDDEPMIVATLERILAREHDVTTAGLAAEAIQRITSGERYDVILSDLMMPQITGMELYATLQTIAPDQASAMIFVTGGAFTEGSAAFLDSVPRREWLVDPGVRSVVNDRIR